MQKVALLKSAYDRQYVISLQKHASHEAGAAFMLICLFHINWGPA